MASRIATGSPLASGTIRSAPGPMWVRTSSGDEGDQRRDGDGGNGEDEDDGDDDGPDGDGGFAATGRSR